jgi:hypothetical protein
MGVTLPTGKSAIMQDSFADDYSPPSSTAIARRQNEVDNLRYLVAQRRLYSKAKLAVSWRWAGMLIIAIVAPLVALQWPHLAVAAGAVAGTWIFLGRTTLQHYKQKFAEQAACIQELFDFAVFDMPAGVRRSATPTAEEIFHLTGDDTEVQQRARHEKLRDWYPVQPSAPGVVSIAICQRANASYADKLLRTTSRVWLSAAIVWALALIILGVMREMSLGFFLLAIVLPLLPTFLDLFEYWRGIRSAANDRRDLAATIEGELQRKSINPQDLLVWQERLFDLRRSTPEVPDFLYWWMRNKNEAAMHNAAQAIARNHDKGGH